MIRVLFWFVLVLMTTALVSTAYETIHENGHGLRMAYVIWSAHVLGVLAGARLSIWALKGLTAARPPMPEHRS